MNLYDRHLAGRLLRAIAQTVVTLVGLFILIDLLSLRLERMDRYETPLLQAVQYYVFMIPEILFEYHILAVSILVGGLMVLGKIAQNNEATSLLAAGVSLRRIAAVPLVIGALIGLFAFTFNEFAGVRLTALQDEVGKRYLERAEGETYQTVSWPHLTDGWSCHVLSFNPKALSGQDVFLHRNTADTLEEIRARRIYWDVERNTWMLEDGRWFSTNTGDAWRQKVTRITSAPAPFTAPPSQLFALDQNPGTRSIVELRAALEQAEAFGTPTARGWLAFHRKLAQPVLCAIMMLLAIPFAMRFRRGGALAGFGISITIALAYMLVFYAGNGLAYIYIIPPALGAWAANVIFGVGGWWLFLRTPT
jgi:lipopolysaccharide export system permease protein